MSQSTPVGAGELLERLRALLAAGDSTGLRSLVAGLHPSDVADLIEALDESERIAFLSSLPVELASDALAEIEEEEHPEDILAALAPRKRAELIHNLSADDAVDLIADLEPEERARLLDQLPAEEAGRLRGLLGYGEETAGGLMTTELVAVLHTLTAREAIEEVRRQGREIEEFYNVFVVDEQRRTLGTVPLDDLILADLDSPVSEIVVPPTVTVLPSTDQEEVGRLMAHYNMVSMAVVSEDGRLLGRITFDDVIDVLEQEQTEDILKLAGLYADEVRGGWGRAVQNRLPWLLVNLGTSLLGASVVYVFSRTIQEAVILASIMPMVAGLGGNAGTQALAVSVRRIALATEPTRARWGVVLKELVVGLVNGAVVGAVAAGLSIAVGGDSLLGLVVLLAMWGNILVANFAGSFVPILLDRLDIDPAVASSIFVTAFTDLSGFFLLLGLGSAILL